MLNVGRRPGQAASAQLVPVPVPIGGINTIAAGNMMPVSDCVYAYNLTAAEYGLRTRLGFRDWCLGLDGEVRSLLPFVGSRVDKSTNKLFACTTSGIWDVTAASVAPTRVVTFGIQNTDSGWGISTVFVNIAGGHFLLYCDEANGYYVYSEANSTWVKVVQAANVEWAPGTVYGANATVTNGGLTYKTAAGGTSAASGGPTGTGNAIVDNTVTWAYTPSIGGVDPTKFAFVTSWKNRIWFVEKDTAHAWYLPIGAIFGTAARYQFGNRLQHGGALVGLWSWTYDGGSGLDDALVIVATGGDLLIYTGIDPNQASGFTLSGVWYIGGVPAGRRIASDSGGDLLVMSSLGVLPVSKLSVGSIILDKSQYKTYKIANLFSQFVLAASGVRGWAIRLHPQDSTIIVIIPTATGGDSIQLAMSYTTQGWGQYRGLPIGPCAESYDGAFYFGTVDGRVCINDGYLDRLQFPAVPWAPLTPYTVGQRVLNDNGKRYKCTQNGMSAAAGGPTGVGSGIVDGTVIWDFEDTTAAPIEFSLLTSFQNLGRPTQKQVQLIRPKFISQDVIGYRATAKYNWNLNEIDPFSGALRGAGAVWDTSKWDQVVWGGVYIPTQKALGSFGLGIEAAIAIRGMAAVRAVLVGIDVSFTEGGFL